MSTLLIGPYYTHIYACTHTHTHTHTQHIHIQAWIFGFKRSRSNTTWNFRETMAVTENSKQRALARSSQKCSSLHSTSGTLSCYANKITVFAAIILMYFYLVWTTPWQPFFGSWQTDHFYPYRTTGSIVRLASSLIKLLENWFPHSLDKLKDEEAKDEGKSAQVFFRLRCEWLLV